MLADLVEVRGELDPAGLAAAADLHLRLDDDGVAEPLGDLGRLLGVVRIAALGDRDPVAREQLLALVLEQVHTRRGTLLKRLPGPCPGALAWHHARPRVA